MINGIWQGQLLDAEKVAETEEFETKIRKAGSNHELRCTDPDCKCYICYKHGKKRKPHFAHIGKSDCAYAQFEIQDTSDKKTVRSELYNLFNKLGYNVKREVKLVNGRKYCDLLLNINNQNMALRIASATMTATYIEEYTKECEQSDCKLLWIAIGDPNDVHYEKHHYHAMRYQFNHTTNKNLLIIDPNAEMVSQIKEDNNLYEYKGQSLDYRYFSENIHNFQIIRPVNELRIVNEELTIDGFLDEYNAWIERKKAALAKMKADIDAEEISRANTQKSMLHVHQPGRYHQFDIGNNFMTDMHLSQHNHNVAAPTMISNYSVGVRVFHSKYGNGQIYDVKNKDNSPNHLIKIKFEDGKTNSFELEVLIKMEMISIV